MYPLPYVPAILSRMLGSHLCSQDHFPTSVIIWKTFTLRCQRAESKHLCLLPQTSALLSNVWPSTCCHCAQDSMYQIINWTGSTGSLDSCFHLVAMTGKYIPLAQRFEPKKVFRLKCIIVIFLHAEMLFTILFPPTFFSPCQSYEWKACSHTFLCYFLSVLLLFVLATYIKLKRS